MPAKFFGKIDINDHGNISSQIPAWSMRQHIDNLEEDVARKKRALNEGLVPQDSIQVVKKELENDEKRLKAIKDSKPELSAVEQDDVAKAYKVLSKEIQDSMFTRSDMHNGFADAHEEARRMIKPIIKVDDKIAALCEANQVKVSKDGKISRNDASRLWKNCGRYLGEATNVETLRRDKATARTRG